MEYTLSYTSAKEFYKSPAHYLLYKSGVKKETAALTFGSAFHVYVLEPEKFNDTYHVIDDRDILKELSTYKQPTSTKAYKEWYDVQLSESKGKEVLTSLDMHLISRMTDSVMANPQAREMITTAVAKEQLIEAELYGVPFKAYIDILHKGYCTDLKSTRSAEPKEFGRDIANNMYYLQGAIYCELTNTREFYYIAVEKSEPYLCQVYRLDAEYLHYGRKLLQEICARFVAWDGSVEGYAQGIVTIEKPKWI